MNLPINPSNTSPSREPLTNVVRSFGVSISVNLPFDEVESVRSRVDMGCKHHVHFANSAIIHFDRCVGGYTEDEREACWYQEEEYNRFQAESRRAAHFQRQIRLHQVGTVDYPFIYGQFVSSLTSSGMIRSFYHGVGVVDDPNRGLEFEIDRELISRRVELSIQAVLAEQELVRREMQGRGCTKKRRLTDHQVGNHINSIVSVAEDRLRRVYQQFSDLAFTEAHFLAKKDEMAVKLDGVAAVLGKAGDNRLDIGGMRRFHTKEFT